MTREAALEDLYQAIGTLVRRSRDLGADLHPGLSVVAYTLLVQVEAEPQARAADLAAHFGLDKSTVSRQLDQLVAAGLLRREGERPGRRGQCLALTDAGRQELAGAGAGGALLPGPVAGRLGRRRHRDAWRADGPLQLQYRCS